MFNKRISFLVSVVMIFVLLFTNLSFAADFYTVKSGDVLWRIAAEHGTTWQELAKINQLKNPNLIFPYQKIKLTADEVVKVEKPEPTPDEVKIILPEWAKAVKPAKEIDKYYMPKYLRVGYNMEAIKKVYGEYVYLLEKFGGYSDDNPNYYGRLYYLGLYGVIIGTYETSLQIADIFKNLPDEQIFYRKIKNGKETVKKISDYKYETYVAPFEFIALYESGQQDKAMQLYNDAIKPNLKQTLPWHTHSIAKVLLSRGDVAGAEAIYDEMPLYQGKNRAYLYSAGCLEACSYYYKKGDYDKVIEMADVYLALGYDAQKAAETIYPDKDIKKIFKNHWEMSYTSLAKYKEMAIAAKAGETIDMNNLKDGVYAHSNPSIWGSPFEVKLTIENGKIKSVEADQNPTGEGIYDKRPFGARDIFTKRIVDANDYSVDAIASATMSSTSIRLSVIEGLLDASK